MPGKMTKSILRPPFRPPRYRQPSAARVYLAGRSEKRKIFTSARGSSGESRLVSLFALAIMRTFNAVAPRVARPARDGITLSQRPLMRVKGARLNPMSDELPQPLVRRISRGWERASQSEYRRGSRYIARPAFRRQPLRGTTRLVEGRAISRVDVARNREAIGRGDLNPLKHCGARAVSAAFYSSRKCLVPRSVTLSGNSAGRGLRIRWTIPSLKRLQGVSGCVA